MIEGIVIKSLVTHKDDRGFFREIFRFSYEFKDITIGQISHSLVNEGVIKAWHGHKEQSQWNYVVQGRIKVVLYDNRESSITYRKTNEFIVGDALHPKAYYFPPGVMHGYKCIEGPMQIIYITSSVFNLFEEIRIPQNDFDYRW